MNGNTHERAQQLMTQRRIEGASCDDQSWLATHLAECEACAALDTQTQAALSAFRTTQIDLPKNLAARTQLRVRLRAEEMNEREPGRKLLWAMVGLSWMLGVASAPLVWRGFAWLGSELSLPDPVWQAGVVLWWLVPGLAAIGAVMLQKKRVEREAE
jgi:hypothetical protein